MYLNCIRVSPFKEVLVSLDVDRSPRNKLFGQFGEVQGLNVAQEIVPKDQNQVRNSVL